ncbi:ABC transporter permease [Aestuariimicrobium soli]|uniref:ABC transporter permease n=1 Tax=Aestuariimicrobium soli TaxID=2035834 RepID=UPI003EBF5611
MTGLASTTRIAWRRSRLFWILWVLALLTLMPMTVIKYHDLVPPGSSPEELMATLGSNPTMRAILGVPHDLSTPGGFTMWRVGAFTGWTAAFVTIFAVIRSTRADEEEGRTELVRSGAVGRHDILGGALVVAMAATAVLGLLNALAMVAEGTPVAGSFATGAGITAISWVFAGVAAVCAQVFESARSARAWAAGIVLGGLYLVRAMVDGSASASVQKLRWVIPLEWPQLLRPYAGERWWVLLLPVALTVVLIGVALVLESRRDFGAGLRATALGRADASPALKDAFGLARRLQRTGVIGWTVGVLVAAYGMGSIGTQIDQMLKDNPQVAEMMAKLGGTDQLSSAFYIAMLGIMTTVIAVAAVQFLGRLHAEEGAGHVEVMAATATPRSSILASHLLIAAVVPAVLVVASGLLVSLGEAAKTSAWGMLGDYGRASLVLLPGLALVIGVGVALLGWRPRWFGLTWAVVGWSMFCSWLAPVFNLPAWLVRAQPWGHLPKLPADPMAWTPVVVESAVAVLLVVLGAIGFRRRDLQTR